MTVNLRTHEAIIPAEQFELVQRILETETRRPNDAETVALFAGFLYCGDCGSRLVRRSASYRGKKYIYYQCSGSKQNKGNCTSHNLRDEKLYNIVRNALQMQIRLFEGIKYVLPILHPNKKRLALIMCPEEDSASVEWARKKDENWVNKDITSLEFVENIFRLMNWNRECRYSGVAGSKWSGGRKRPSV